MTKKTKPKKTAKSKKPKEAQAANADLSVPKAKPRGRPGKQKKQSRKRLEQNRQGVVASQRSRWILRSK